MAETLNESVARQEATNETLTNRMHTLEEFYTEKYNLLKGISETHPDCFKTPFKLVSFAVIIYPRFSFDIASELIAKLTLGKSETGRGTVGYPDFE